MVITCYSCSTRFNLDESLVKPNGTKVRCSRCKHFFIIYPPVQEKVEAQGDFSDSNFNAEIALMKGNKGPVAESKDIEGQDIPVFGTSGAMNVKSGKNFPSLDLDESEFSYLELAGLEIDTDIGIGEDEPDKGPLQDQSDSESKNDASQLKSLDVDMPELELNIDTLGLELDIDTIGMEQDIDTPGGVEQQDIDTLGLEQDIDTSGGVEQQDIDTLGLEQDIDTSGGVEQQDIGILGLEQDDNEFDEDETDLPDFDMEITEHAGPSELVRVEEDDPEFELEFDRDPDPEPPFPEDESVEEAAPVAIGQTEFEKQDLVKFGSAVTQKRKFSPVVILLPSLLLFIVGGAIIASLMTGYKIPIISDIKIPYLEKILKKEQPPKTFSAPVPDQKKVTGRFVTNSTAGSLFVITGIVENPSTISYSHIQVKGALITKDKIEVKTGLAFCGNIIPDKMLKTGTIADINAALTIKKGANGSNVNIKPGAFVPYMLVFSDLSDQLQKLQSFTVRVNAYDKKQSQ